MTVRASNGEEVSKTITTWLLSLSGVVLMLLGWTASISFSAGERSRQLDINTTKIEEVDRNGTSGTKAKLEDLTKSVDRMSDTIEHLNSRIDTMLGKQRQ
jgi:hypothetical protein